MNEKDLHIKNKTFKYVGNILVNRDLLEKKIASSGIYKRLCSSDSMIRKCLNVDINSIWEGLWKCTGSTGRVVQFWLLLTLRKPW